MCLALCGCCFAQAGSTICDHGASTFRATLGKVSVYVGPSRIGELAARNCAAEMTWNKHVDPIASDAAKLGMDVFAADLGRVTPVIGFQVQISDAACCAQYQVFALDAPVKPVRTITGSASFYAVDSDLDGQVEIWTHDDAVIDGFDGLSLAEFDEAPVVILRFAGGKLMDVTSEFRGDLDRKIASWRDQINSGELIAFKNGKVHDASLTAESQHRLRALKVKILEIVSAYLYSGREDRAWSSLADMWPIEDVPRIRELMVSARARGIHSQTDGDGAPNSRKRAKRAPVFDATSVTSVRLSPPQPIIMTRPPLEDSRTAQAEASLDLIIDCAGKVNSVTAAGKSSTDQALLEAAQSWQFIPALKDGMPVASRLKLSVSLKQ